MRCVTTSISTAISGNTKTGTINGTIRDVKHSRLAAEINEGFAALKSAAPVRQLIDFAA